MLAGTFRLLTGFAVTIVLWLFYALVLPLAVMVVVLYLVRLIPLTGRRQSDDR